MSLLNKFIVLLLCLFCFLISSCGEVAMTATPIPTTSTTVAEVVTTPTMLIPATLTQIPIMPTHSATTVPVSTIKPITVFGQGIGTSLNAKGEPQSPTARYQEGTTVYFFLNFQDADPKELTVLTISSLSSSVKVFSSQKPFGNSKGFITFEVSNITPGAYQAAFMARKGQVGSLFNFEVLPKPTPTVAPILPTAIKLPALNSQGIGLTREEWEAINGQPSPEYQHSTDSAAYKGNDFVINFTDDKIFGMSLQQFDKNPTDLSTAKAVVLSYMPVDSKFIKTYKDAITGDTTYVYQSKSIIARFPAADFPWTIPNTQGQILVSFLPDTNDPSKISDMDIVLGSEEDLDQ